MKCDYCGSPNTTRIDRGLYYCMDCHYMSANPIEKKKGETLGEISKKNKSIYSGHNL